MLIFYLSSCVSIGVKEIETEENKRRRRKSGGFGGQQGGRRGESGRGEVGRNGVVGGKKGTTQFSALAILLNSCLSLLLFAGEEGGGDK